MVLGIACEHICHTGFHTDANQGKKVFLFPFLGFIKLVITEFNSRLIERVIRMRLRKRHRHIHVGCADIVGGIEDLFIEDRVDRVHDEVDLIFLCQVFDALLVARVDELYREPFCISQFFLHFFRAFDVVICQHHLFHPRTWFGNGGNGFPNSTHSN